METNVGILGLDLYLPPEIRRNDWWPPEVIARWSAGRAASPPPREAAAAAPTEGIARVLRALAAQTPDPFSGIEERRVMPPAMSVLDMQEHAARAALARAGVEPGAVDLVLTHTMAPDDLLGNPACQLHHRLGLAPRCLALEVEAAQYAFFAQLALAESMIRAGRATRALLVQACGASRLVEADDPVSAVFGDGATAVVVGPVRAGHGVLGLAHHADGRFGRSLVAGVRGGRWYDAGRAVVHIGDPREMQEVLLQTADRCKDGVDAALAAAGLAPADVAFLGVHQGTAWLRRVVQDHLGLSHARTVETFTRTGYLFGATLPASLAIAERERLVSEPDVVVLTGGGTGMTYGAVALRWGGR